MWDKLSFFEVPTLVVPRKILCTHVATIKVEGTYNNNG